MKILIGLVAALLIGWIWHGPLGNGRRLIDGLEAQAREQVAGAEVPGIRVALSRDPLARVAILSGPANDLQREGLGSQKGISDLVRDVEGMASVRWTDEPESKRRVTPLLVETLALAALAYLIGLGLGWLVWGRRRREGFA
ncbi:MAG TPA: hypothetical protein VFQ67_07850 [Allosphingosinicella sp.]|jgi:hypothetical protein|nr:hypothetical protein [Allosphingosinicella sp.]